MGLSSVFLLGLVCGLETKEEQESSIKQVEDVFKPWQYRLLSLYEPKPLDLAFKLFLLEESRDQKTATDFYDGLRQTNRLIKPDMEYFQENIAWLKKFVNNTEHMNFVNTLNTYRRARFLSLDRIPGLDQTVDCWVIMAYNSTKQQQSDLDLGQRLLEHFDEKCQVGFFDFAFPSNFKFLSGLFVDDTTLLLRFPNEFISNTHFHPQQWAIELRPTDQWGEVLYSPALETLGEDVFKHIEDTIYTQMSDEQKIRAVYSQFNDAEPEKRMMREIIYEYQRGFQTKVRDFMNTIVGTDPQTGEWDQEALRLAYPDIIKFQDDLIENDSLENYIQSRLSNETYMNEREYEVDQITRTLPVTHI